VIVVRGPSRSRRPARLLVTRAPLAAQAGDPAVGKTALVQMFSSSGAKFPKTYQMTCGVEFCSKQVPIPDTDVSVELHIFDTGGQDLFTEMLPSLWKVPRRPLTPLGLQPLAQVGLQDLVYRVAAGERARCAGGGRTSRVCAGLNCACPHTPGWRGDRAGVRPDTAVHLRGVPQLVPAGTRGAATAAQHGQKASSGRQAERRKSCPHLRLEASSRLSTAALWAPRQSCGRGCAL